MKRVTETTVHGREKRLRSDARPGVPWTQVAQCLSQRELLALLHVSRSLRRELLLLFVQRKVWRPRQLTQLVQHAEIVALAPGATRRTDATPSALANVSALLVDREPPGALPPRLSWLQWHVEQQVPALPTGLRWLEVECARLSSLPEGLGCLMLGSGFNHELPALPSSLRALSFGRDFDRALPPLPEELRSLHFGMQLCLRPGAHFRRSKGVVARWMHWRFTRFDQPLPERLPSGLRVLSLSSAFNQPIPPGVLPQGLRTLLFGWRFSQALGEGVLPRGLTQLRLGVRFNHAELVLPAALCELRMGDAYFRPLPPLPEGLMRLALGSRFNLPLTKLSRALEVLRLGCAFDQVLPELPPALHELHLGHAFNRPLPRLPAGLRVLVLGDSFDQDLKPGTLPRNMTRLSFGLRFNRVLLEDSLPRVLEELSFGACFNRALPTLPTGLRKLVLGDGYRHPLGPLPTETQVVFEPHVDA